MSYVAFRKAAGAAVDSGELSIRAPESPQPAVSRARTDRAPGSDNFLSRSPEAQATYPEIL
jgi:hypothetical protein